MQKEFKIGLLATGSELLDGRISDSNGRLLANTLATLGLKLDRIIICGDTQAEIESSLECLGSSFDIVITTGGLGPTFADQTRAAVASFCHTRLVAYEDAITKLEKFFAARGRQPTKSDYLQSMFPEGSTRIENMHGTADGFYLTKEGTTYISLPGVPREFSRLCQESVMDLVRKLYLTTGGLIIEQNLFCCYSFGVGEAVVGEYLNQSTHLRIRAASPYIEIACSDQEQLANAVQSLPRDYIYSSSHPDISESVIALLRNNSLTLSAAESCTGGLMGALLTRSPGVSDVYLGGVIAYSNGAKTGVLDVPDEIIGMHGAVSYECVQSMAEKVRSAFNSSIGLSISGVAGPTGGSDANPVGTVYIGLATGHCSKQFKVFIPGERERVQLFSVWHGLDILRRHLTGLQQRVTENR